jgi:hypothetical protein
MRHNECGGTFVDGICDRCGYTYTAGDEIEMLLNELLEEEVGDA